MAKTISLVLMGQLLEESTCNRYTFYPCQSLPLRGRWHGEAVTERVCLRDEPSQSRCARQLVPLFVAYRRHLPPAGGSLSKGEPLAEPESFVLHSSTAGRSQPISGKLYALAKASPFRERWHGEAVTERVASGTNPLSLAALDSSPEGRALGRTGEFRPHSLTAERIQLLSCKLSAFAKASPFRERWHGEAVTERVAFRLAAAFGKRFSHGPAERPSSLESRY